MMKSKYNLAVCHLYHPDYDGLTINSSNNIVNHFLLNEIININSFYNYSYFIDICIYQLFYFSFECSNVLLKKHPNIRNYKEIMNYYKLSAIEIVSYDILDGGEMVCYLKTFWLKIFQKKWKAYYKKLNKKIQIMKHPQNILKRELFGK